MEAHMKPEYCEKQLPSGIDPEIRRSLLQDCVSVDLMRGSIDSSKGALPKVDLFDSKSTAPESHQPSPAEPPADRGADPLTERGIHTAPQSPPDFGRLPEKDQRP